VSVLSIVEALLARNNPVGALVAGLFCGYLWTGAQIMERSSDVGMGELVVWSNKERTPRQRPRVPSLHCLSLSDNESWKRCHTERTKNGKNMLIVLPKTLTPSSTTRTRVCTDSL